MKIPKDHDVVGTCGVCAGPVTSIRGEDTNRTCLKCGAEADGQYGPVLKML